MDEEKLEIKHYWRIVRKWWWLPLCSVVGAIVVAFLISNGMTPKYRSTAKVMVQGGQNPGAPSLSDIEAVTSHRVV